MPDKFLIESLAAPTVKTPIQLPSKREYISDERRILYEPEIATVKKTLAKADLPASFEIAGPRQKIFFEPRATKAAIVTCGGLCPGINAVIRGIVMQLWHRYGVRTIAGIRYGYQGLSASATDSLVVLEPERVESIHEEGGTILGSSRGTPPTAEIVDTLVRHNINILFAIGGDGTMRGAKALCEEIKARNLQISVVGIPKTIDNDVPFVRRSFGFETAVAIATPAVRSAHVEAKGVLRGIGLVKLMGRHSGYITANAALASSHPNFCLIPEVPFALEGSGGLLDLVEQRLRSRAHALIVVAEGAGQHYFKDQPVARDASGNAKLGDIGTYLRDRLNAHFHQRGLAPPVRYIDPSYLIRSAPANPADALFCARLAQNAVHAAMAGKTAMLVGYWHGVMTHVPLAALENERQTINPNGELWFNVLETTGQPPVIGKVEGGA